MSFGDKLVEQKDDSRFRVCTDPWMSVKIHGI